MMRSNFRREKADGFRLLLPFIFCLFVEKWSLIVGAAVAGVLVEGAVMVVVASRHRLTTE